MSAATPVLPVNRAPILAEVEAAFARYEAALVANDISVLDELFLEADHTVRYGTGEHLHGFAEIAAFRRQRPANGLMRTLERTVITTFGDDCATAWTLFRRPGAPGMVGRQSQVWVRTGAGWRIAAAHVSLIPDPQPLPAEPHEERTP